MGVGDAFGADVTRIKGCKADTDAGVAGAQALRAIIGIKLNARHCDRKESRNVSGMLVLVFIKAFKEWWMV